MASRLLLIAPDPSGDTLGAHFCKVWRKGGGGQVWALGGDQLRQEGAEVKWDSAPFQTLGFLDALFKLPQTRPLWKEIIRTLPLVNGVVVVDARFLMERIAPHVQRAGLPLVWLAPSPDWRKAGESTSRTERLSLLVDYLWVTDPLAWRAYKNSEKATRFAHPRFQDTPSVKREKGLLALLPGSRPSEIIRNKNTFIKAASLMDWAKSVDVSDPFGIEG
nr:hypothetical protein [bacterium]